METRLMGTFIFAVAEYIGNVPADKREEVIQQLNKEVERLVKVVLSLLSTLYMLHTLILILRIINFIAKDAVPVRVEKNEKGMLTRDLNPSYPSDITYPKSFR